MEGTPKEISQLEAVLQNLPGFKKTLVPELDDRWRFSAKLYHQDALVPHFATRWHHVKSWWKLHKVGSQSKNISQLQVKLQNLPGFKKTLVPELAARWRFSAIFYHQMAQWKVDRSNTKAGLNSKEISQLEAYLHIDANSGGAETRITAQ